MSMVVDPVFAGPVERSIDGLVAAEEQRFLARTRRSSELFERAKGSLAGGVTSSWMSSRPVPVWVDRGEGSRIWDADGTEYVDLHGGYGVMAVGHAHPAIVAAVSRRVAQGTHFAQPVEDAIVVAEELARRFGPPMWRFGNSGSEATMDAIHLMRCMTGRDLIIKIEGSYHGHHDSVMVSIFRSVDQLGPAENPRRIPGGGVPQSAAELVRIVPFNDLDALERLLAAESDRIAGMIMEPMLMNAGIIEPEPGYLQGVRALTRRYGVLLTFDEVKTGLTVHWGGCTAKYGVTPDIVCLAKALGGGLPCGAVGGTAEVMSAIGDGRYDQVGTFNGNPLTMAAARCVLTEILDEAAYEHGERLGRAMLDTSVGLLAAAGVPAHGHVTGLKGSLVFGETPPRNYREFLAIDTALSHCHFLFQNNGGVFLPPWGKSEQWTLSVQHTLADTDRFCDNIARLADSLRGVTEHRSQIFESGGFA